MYFNALPAELQYAIWDFAMPDPEPEVCVIWGARWNGDAAPGTIEPLLVDTAFPVSMHVCRAWRAYVLQTAAASPTVVPSSSHPTPPRVRFRASRRAGFPVPYRAFRPDLDALYLTKHKMRQIKMIMVRRGLTAAALQPVLDPVRRLAVSHVDMRAAGRRGAPNHYLPCVILHLPRLTHLVVVSHPTEEYVERAKPHRDATPFQIPARRCKLRQVEPDPMGGEDVWSHLPEWHESFPMLFQPDFPSSILHTRLREKVRRRWTCLAIRRGWGLDWYKGSLFNGRERGGDFYLEYLSATFFEYRRGDDGWEAWEETCKKRMFGLREQNQVDELSLEESLDFTESRSKNSLEECRD